jgi:hypothetical protein
MKSTYPNKPVAITSLLFVLENIKVSMMVYFELLEIPIKTSTDDSLRQQIHFLRTFKSRSNLNKKIFCFEKITNPVVSVEKRVYGPLGLLDGDAEDIFKLFEQFITQKTEFPLPRKVSKRENYEEMKAILRQAQELNFMAILLVI